ncbi:MAG: 1-deoxy-D-xylulose-5-phosphate synthase [Bacteroidales bacterium]|nr:1-deoxy-D-xylulose-5-phosphate synthase [Bacteroidales bacterium]
MNVQNNYRIGPLLSKIDSPVDLKKLSEDQLPQLCQEIRDYIVDTLADNPGHFGASLGVVELTVAMHYVFNTPHDKLVWDVGHQAYGHKILTGRRDRFTTNRKLGGISGFPKISESPYDSFGVGHSSTSISAALGMAMSAKLSGEKNRQHVAIIGDGAMSAGQAFEGLNNAGITNTNLLVILNDNNMSIDKGVGSLKEFLLDVTTSKTYNRLKDKTYDALGVLGTKGPTPRRIVSKFMQALKNIFLKRSEYMESLNMRYFGPIDGHDVERLVKVLRSLSKLQGPKLLHVITKKGKGFSMAEMNQTTYHAPGPFNKDTGEILKKESSKPTAPKYQDVYGKTLLELAKADSKVVGITPAMLSGSSLTIMQKEIPERVFDVGIAEQHAVTYAAGMAISGMIPFCTIYSTFLQRAYDQVIHDVALQKLPVIFGIDRGGLVGADGPTHHGVFDLAYLRVLPNMIIAEAMNEIELRNLMFTAKNQNDFPFAIRYPRGNGVLTDWEKPMERLKIGKGEILRNGEKLAILTLGHVGNFAISAAERLESDGHKITVANMRFLKPFDEPLLKDILSTHQHIITVENGTVVGGFGSQVIEMASELGFRGSITKLGVPDHFIEHGTPEELMAECGFDAAGIYAKAKEILK